MNSVSLAATFQVLYVVLCESLGLKEITNLVTPHSNDHKPRIGWHKVDIDSNKNKECILQEVDLTSY